MVICTNIKDGMVFAIVPADEHIFLLGEREEIITTFCNIPMLLHLRQKPGTGDNGMCLQKFETGSGTHLTTDYTLQILLYRQFVDGTNLIRLDHETQCSEESLGFLALPMEVDTNRNIAQREGSVRTLWMESQGTILITVPEYTTF